MSPLLTGFAFGGGVSRAAYTATTGSPTIDTSSRAGKTIIKYTGSGSITIGTAGTCEVLVVGGGGGAGTSGSLGVGGGGAGGYYYDTAALIQSGTLTVTVGSGGTGGNVSSGVVSYSGIPSKIGTLIAIGGGASGTYGDGTGIAGGSGAGGSGVRGGGSNVGGTGYQGNSGGTATSSGGAGGGGAGAAGSSQASRGGCTRAFAAGFCAGA